MLKSYFQLLIFVYNRAMIIRLLELLYPTHAKGDLGPCSHREGLDLVQQLSISKEKEFTFGYLRIKNLTQSSCSAQNGLSLWFHGPGFRCFSIKNKRVEFSFIL